VKLRLGQLDPEFQAAVENAWRLGPWEPEVQFALAQIAFRARDKLGPGAQAATRSAIGSAARQYPKELSALARRHGAVPMK
jgi:hypothetical protein